MIIAEVREKCKSSISRIPRDAFVVLVLLLASSFSFGLGYLAGIDAGQASAITLTESPSVTPAAGGEVVASKNGTKYYFIGCAGAGRISKENQIWFTTEQAAISAGYALAANCKGQ